MKQLHHCFSGASITVAIIFSTAVANEMGRGRENGGGRIEDTMTFCDRQRCANIERQLSEVPVGTSFLLITCSANYLQEFRADVCDLN